MILQEDEFNIWEWLGHFFAETAIGPWILAIIIIAIVGTIIIVIILVAKKQPQEVSESGKIMRATGWVIFCIIALVVILHFLGD